MEIFEVFLIFFTLFLAAFSGLFIVGIFLVPLISIKSLLLICLILALLATGFLQLERFKLIFKKFKRI